MRNLINIIRGLCDNYIGAILGNKQDLFIKEEVSEEEAREFAEGIGFKFALVSAKIFRNRFIELLEELVKDFIEGNNILNEEIIKQKERQKEFEKEKERMNIDKKSLIINYKLNLLKYFSK